MGLTASVDSLFTIVTTPTLTTRICGSWTAVPLPLAFRDGADTISPCSFLADRLRGGHALFPVALVRHSQAVLACSAQLPPSGLPQTGFSCRISMNSGPASDFAFPGAAGQDRRGLSSHPVPSEARTTTTMRLVAQLEHLSEVTEALTYRLLELEERLLAWDGPHQHPADPVRRSGGS